jgi:DNA-binding phage protein
VGRSGLALACNDLESLNAAFATNNLQCICRAVDAAVLQSGSIIEIARAAELDRATLYRAFRLERGPALDTMIKVLRVLGFELVVEVQSEVANSQSKEASPGGGSSKPQAVAIARRFTAAFKTGEMKLLLNVFKETLYSQDNVAQLASKTIRTREALYRVFDRNPMPRFSTLLSFLNALELRFAVRRLPHRFRLRLDC